MKTMVIVAHPDDEVLSAGALIYRRAGEKGGDVRVVVVYGRTYPEDGGTLPRSESDDFEKARSVLGHTHPWLLGVREGEPENIGYYMVLRHIESALKSYKPHTVVVPSGADMNQDHKYLARICEIALRAGSLPLSVRCVLEATTPSLGWSQFNPNWFLCHDKAVLDAKLAAMQCYRRESRVSPHPRCPENIEAQHRMMGARAGAEFAEGYRLLLHRG